MNATASLTEIVHSLYAAFGRGDIAAILAQLRPDVKWGLNADPAAPGAAATPILRMFNGAADVANFFAIIGHDLEFHSFEPIGFTSNANEVVARVLIDATVKKTKRRMCVESLHHFTFDAEGRLVRFREFTDTLAVAASWDTVRTAQ